MKANESAAEALPFAVTAVSVLYALFLGFLTNRRLGGLYPENGDEKCSHSAVVSVTNWTVDIQLFGTSAIAWAFAFATFQRTWGIPAIIAMAVVAAVCVPLLMVADPVTYGTRLALTRRFPLTYVSILVVSANSFVAVVVRW
jgi:hypothetical protein